MILTAHQPTYLPWLGLFHKIALADKFILLDTVQYVPKEWMNRNKIKTPQGFTWLTVPVINKGHLTKKIKEILIRNELNWRKEHLKSIAIHYKNTPYYNEYYSFFEETLGRKWEYLSDLNEYMLKWFIDQLGIKVKFLKASDYDFKGAKSNFILDICKKLKANMFIFGSLGKNYVEKDIFEKNDIIPYFQNYNHPTYPQKFNNFISNLSIIDLLFNCGPKSLEIIMSENIKKNELQVIK